MSLPKTITETAAMVYRNFENNNDAKGKSILCMAAATIYMACKRCSVVRSLDEIVKAGGTMAYENPSCKLASKYYRMMVMEMGMSGNFHKDMEQKSYLAVKGTYKTTQTNFRDRNQLDPARSLVGSYEESRLPGLQDTKASLNRAEKCLFLPGMNG